MPEPAFPSRRSLQARSALLLIGCWLELALAATAAGEGVPRPDDFLGFRPGADYRLAEWSKVVDYVRALDRESERVVVRDLGTSTEGRPLVLAVVSDTATIRSLDRFREAQARLADPRRCGSVAECRAT